MSTRIVGKCWRSCLLLVQHNDTGLVVSEVAGQLGNGRRIDGSGRTTTGNAFGETFSGADDASGDSLLGKAQSKGEKRKSHVGVLNECILKE